MCEMLVECGHNTEYRDPYKYPFRMLVAVSRKCSARRRKDALILIGANHLSRISCATGDAKDFNEYIRKITEE